MNDPQAYRPRGLMFALTVLIVLGMAGVVGSVVNAQATLAAKRDASVANNKILREIRQQNYDLCLRANEIAARAGIDATDCVRPKPIDELEDE